jgi:hypothetical protein
MSGLFCRRAQDVERPSLSIPGLSNSPTDLTLTGSIAFGTGQQHHRTDQSRKDQSRSRTTTRGIQLRHSLMATPFGP